MPTYAYRAKNTALRVVEGVIEAENESAALARLGSQGIYPLAITEAPSPRSTTPARGPSLRRAPSRAVAYLSRQLADLIGGGLSLFHALSLLSEQTEHPVLRRVTMEMSQSVREGQALSEALGRHRAIFSPLFINMIRAGEATGDLETVLTRLADLLEGESEVKSRVMMALVYPAVVLAIGAATVVVLLTYVVPKLTALFEDTGGLLPLPTRILLGISDGLTRGWWLWIGAGLVAIWGLGQLRSSSAGRAVLDRMSLRLPLGGALVRKLYLARFLRSLGAMIGQGVPALQALEVAGSTVSNRVLHGAIQRVRDAVQDGASLSSALSASGEFPAFVSNMVAVGQESGTLDAALAKVATSYERDADRAIRALTTALEPLLIVVVGLVVMFIVIAMLLPIFNLGLVAG